MESPDKNKQLRRQFNCTYSSWYNMIQRCYNPKDIVFKYYGARGILLGQIK